MNPGDTDPGTFQKQLQGLMASERARYLARSELVEELITANFKAQEIGDFKLSPLWIETIASMLKFGLEDSAMRVLLKTLYEEQAGAGQSPAQNP